MVTLYKGQIKDVIEQRPYRFQFTRCGQGIHCIVIFNSSPLTFKKPLDDLEASTEVRQRKLIELSPTLDKAEVWGNKYNVYLCNCC